MRRGDDTIVMMEDYKVLSLNLNDPGFGQWFASG